ncbi:nucleoside 2-deoxyribosyltransferase [Candidatus Pacearchaeota archaeon]|nr:nucleoside 2-deoxyribosyltransferase [Candidatus Pacearchaeota archaeon]
MGVVYLAGPIMGNDYSGATDWRREAASKLESWGIRAVSPMRGKENLGKERAIKDSYDGSEIATPLTVQKGIVTRDRFDTTSCDLMIANLLDAKKVSIGTMIEYGWADAFRKPVITVMEKEGNVHDHGMVRGLTGFRVETLEEGLLVAKILLVD